MKKAFNTKSFKKVHELFQPPIDIDTGNINLKDIQIIGFKNNNLKPAAEAKLILKLEAKPKNIGGSELNYFVQTGLFAGQLQQRGCQFNITSAYGKQFLQRMLNYAQNIFLVNEEFSASQKSNDSEFQYILAYLFIQSLEKMAVVGMPKQYTKVTQRSHKVRGSINFSEYIKNDTPFKGKISSSYREQVYVQEIIDVLYAACQKLKSNYGPSIQRKIHNIYTTLRQNYSGVHPSANKILSSKNHEVLQNPLFSAFSEIITYAELIIKNSTLIEDKNNSKKSYGYLFDISQLFEVYLEKLLQKHFGDWIITGQEELTIYEENFYKRRMLPDIVMRHKETGKVIVFDAKYKKMEMEKGQKYNDLDRNDFFQIHTYMQYYQADLMLGGLIYPLSKEISESSCHSTSLFGRHENGPKFIVDGIFIKPDMNMEEIETQENLFLNRIESVISP